MVQEKDREGNDVSQSQKSASGYESGSLTSSTKSVDSVRTHSSGAGYDVSSVYSDGDEVGFMEERPSLTATTTAATTATSTIPLSSSFSSTSSNDPTTTASSTSTGARY